MSFMITKNIALALKTLRASRGRTTLTMLGVIIAVAAVTTIVGIGNGIRSEVVDQANQYSKNVITIRPTHISNDQSAFSGLASSAVAASLTDADVAAIDDVKSVTDVVPLSVVGTNAKGDGEFKGPILAAGGDLSSVINQDLAYGTFFGSNENNTSVAVLGADAAEQIFNQRVPLGRAFNIGNQQFIVNGILERFETTPFTADANFNDAVFVPSGATKSLRPNGAGIYQILAKVDGDVGMKDADKDIAAALNASRQGENDISVLTPGELAEQTTESFDLLTYFVLAAAIVTLLVSGVGIMNVMLVSVTERIHEIGIRKAVGATNRQIRNQFLTEAIVLCVFGSLIGIVVSLIVTFLLHVFSPLGPVYDVRVALAACVAACVFGTIFGTVPAIKAARKDPILALRSE